MAVERLTASFDSELASAIRAAAADDGLNTSAWLAQAARRRLATLGLANVIAEWEAEYGAFTHDELTEARARLSP